jgi:hypothetical protein
VLLVELFGDVLEVPELGLAESGCWLPVVLLGLWLWFEDVDGDCGLAVVLCALAIAAAHTKPVISRPWIAIFSNCFTDEFSLTSCMNWTNSRRVVVSKNR